MAVPLAIASAAITAGGEVIQGVGQGRAASYQAQVARNNAQIARQNAARAAEGGAAQTEQAGMRARARDAAVRASLAANGVDVNSGSAADVQVGQREIGALDTQTVARNAALEAYGYGTQATSYDANANLLGQEAKFAPIEGVIKGTGTLLGNPSVDSGLSDAAGSFGSLLSGNPEIPPAYKWMTTDTQDTGITYG